MCQNVCQKDNIGQSRLKFFLQQTQMSDVMMYQPAKPAPTIVNAVRSCPNEKFCLHTSRHVQYDAKFELIGTPSMTLHASG